MTGLCRRIKGAAEFFLDLEEVGCEEGQSLGNQAELQEGLLQLGREMRSEVLALLNDQNVCSWWVMGTPFFYWAQYPSSER